MSCPTPFLDASTFSPTGGFIDGRICESLGTLTCCLPCPMTNWAYSDAFNVVNKAAEWVSVFSTACCLFLLLSWTVLPIDKTHRHYLSICLTIAVVFMNLGFIIPLAARPDQCYNSITPNDMQTSSPCAASGTFIVLGGWAAILWVFLRSLSLHLQICWQVVVGRNFLWFSQGLGWGVPVAGTVLALTLSGVSFRFGNTCHINHANSLADMWIPLLVFAGATLIIQFATFGYCIKVYLASLADNNNAATTTEGSVGLPSYANSLRTMTPRQAYRRVRRVLQLQWRGIAIVLIIITDVIFFAIVFVFQDDTVQAIKVDPTIASSWVSCLLEHEGNKTPCLSDASGFVVGIATIGAVLILLAMNGLWLLILLGRWSMVTGWIELVTLAGPVATRREFVSVDALGGPSAMGGYDLKLNAPDPRAYEMLSRDKENALVTSDMFTVVRAGPVYPPLRSYLAATAAQTPPSRPTTAEDFRNTSASGGGSSSGRRTPDYFGGAARYQPPTRSFSSPRPPTREGPASQAGSGWEAATAADAQRSGGGGGGGGGAAAAAAAAAAGWPYSPQSVHHYSQHSYSSSHRNRQQHHYDEDMNPLQMNRI
ncbi:unnamed protein product [Discula destructiva]